MRLRSFYSTASIMALTFAVAGAAHAQDIIGDTGNSAQIDMVGAITGVGEIGAGSSVSISAAGAHASVAGLASGANFASTGTAPLTPSVGNIDLAASNSGPVTNGAVAPAASSQVQFSNATGSVGVLQQGASASISSLGASASVSFTGIGAGSYTVQPLANGAAQTITLEAENSGTINTTGTTITSVSNTISSGPRPQGSGSSLSIGATGAATGVSMNAVSATNFATSGIGPIAQESVNEAPGTVTASGNAIVARSLGTSNNNNNSASSVSIGATGAVASVSTSAITSGGFTAGFGMIGQTADNAAGVSNINSSIRSGSLQGDGAGLSVSAAGSVASVSELLVGNTANTASTFGNITQTSDNDGAIALTDGAALASNSSGAALHGTGTNLNMTASGASASVSSTVVRSTAADMGTFGTIGQTVTNDGTVAASGNTATVQGAVGGAGAGVSVAAIGASGSVSATTIQGAVTMAATGGAEFGNIDQTIENNGGVLSTGSTIVGGGTPVVPFELSGTATSAGLAAIGAAGSVTGSVVVCTNACVGRGATFSDVTTGVTNNAGVTLTSGTVTVGALSGSAASASLSAVGAQASAGSVSIDSRGAGNNMANFGLIWQTVNNAAPVTLSASTLTTDTLSGAATSAQMGATGASASVNATLVSSSTGTGLGANFGAILLSDSQYAANSGAVQVQGTAAAADVSVGALSGTAASASISGVGASASVSTAIITPGGVSSGVDFIGAVDSTALNTATVTVNNARIATTDPIGGIAASASIIATGASASAAASVIAAAQNVGTVIEGSTNFGAITQMANSSNLSGPSAVVSNSQLQLSGISGTAASAGIGATGASASVQASYIGSTAGTVIGARFGDIVQGTGVAPILNVSPVDVETVSVSGGDLTGPASSASVSAQGAQASVGVAAIGNVGSTTGTQFGTVSQAVENRGNVLVNGATVNVASLGGPASSAGISARGASASVGVSEIGSSVAMGSSSFDAITQNTINSAAINVQNASITSTSGILGTGASASIAASGASANFAVTSVSNTAAMAPIQVAAITQNVTNTAAISNSGTITVGGALGTASSASISATGASTGVSFTSIAP